MKRIRKDGEAGFTLIEIMATTVVVVIGMVLVMGSLAALTGTSISLDKKVVASNYARSMLEMIRGNDLPGILAFEIPFSKAEGGYFFRAPGLGDVRLEMWAVMEDGTRFLIGVDDPALVDSAPNPIEVIVELEVYEGNGLYHQSSALLSYL